MKTSALPELAARYELNERQQAQLSEILSGVSTDERAPTTVRDASRALDVHVADSLVALELDAVRGARDFVDLGAGAGFPGLPLAVALPDGCFRLVESQERKCEFIEGLITRAGIANAQAVWTRAEQWATGIGANDVVLARALAQSSVVLEYAAPLLRVGGALIDWRGRLDPEEKAANKAVAEQLGLALVEIRHAEPYPGARDHHLHIYRKVGETPERFPRRAGIARKRPLTPSDRDQR